MSRAATTMPIDEINTLRLTESGQQVWRSARARIDRHSASMLSGLKRPNSELTPVAQAACLRTWTTCRSISAKPSAATADRSPSLVPPSRNRTGTPPPSGGGDFLATTAFAAAR